MRIKSLVLPEIEPEPYSTKAGAIKKKSYHLNNLSEDSKALFSPYFSD